jgi:hypothetical protein
VKSPDEEYDPEFWEPFEALKPFFNLKALSASRKKKINESMFADLFGDERIDPPPSNFPSAVTNLMYAIMELHSSIHRFSTYVVMFQRYPWRGKIARSHHFESAYYLYVHECYIFEERLKRYFKAADAYASLRGIDIDVNPIRKMILQAYQKSFRGPLSMRGQHVHIDDYIPRNIQRIGLLERMAMVGTLKKKSDHREFRQICAALIKSSVSEARRTWIDNCASARNAARQAATASFRLTKPIWTRLGSESEVSLEQ